MAKRKPRAPKFKGPSYIIHAFVPTPDGGVREVYHYCYNKRDATSWRKHFESKGFTVQIQKAAYKKVT